MFIIIAQLDWLEPFASPVAQRIILVGALTNIACALVGCYLVLRRMSLMGDAIAHAVLPGLVLAFIFSGSLNIAPLFLGAAAVGLLTTFLTQTLHQYGRVPTDASMGVVFTSLFALGVVLLKTYVSKIHFDVDCVFEGLLYQAGFDTFEFAGYELPRQLRTVVPVVIINLAVIFVLWKELKVSAFDPALATSMGISATLMHYLLMMLVAVTTVASFEVVGSILVIAMLIVPPATAQLLTNRLAPMIAVACVFAILSAILGYWLASEQVWNVDPSGAMVVAAGGMYALAVLFAPQYGILSTLIRNLQTALRILREDLLLMLYRLEEIDATKRMRPEEAVAAVGGGSLARWALAMLRHRGRIEIRDGRLHMTDDGRWRAARLVRGHRLWETYLVKNLGLQPDHVHAPADRVEHFIHQPLREELQKELEDTHRDPHGRDIPDLNS
ncbi:MAG: metal ABC transporter permease [Planctomycetes bacterium]|nr:metal ABC transporter permease [Planctomycetota bacterium]